MTYDELYEHVVAYVAMPHTTITVHDQRRALLIIGVFMEFILDCQDQGIDLNKIDITNFTSDKLDELEAKQ